MKNFTMFLLFGLMLSIGCQKAENVFPEPKLEPAFLSVRQAISFLNNGGVQTLDVATNATQWTAQAVYPDGAPTTGWLTLTQVPGTPAQLIITAAENSVMDERWAQVEISTPNLPVQTVRVVQFGTQKKILITDVQGNLLVTKAVDAKAQSFDFVVLTNCPSYEVSQSDGSSTWVTVDGPAVSRAFDDYKENYTVQVTKNTSTDAGRSTTITARGTGLGVGVSVTLAIDQTPDARLDPIAATFLSYSGKVAGSDIPDRMFDNNFSTFFEASYQAGDGAASTTMEFEVKADKLFQIWFYPRNYNPSTGAGSSAQYPADFTLEIQKSGSSTWEKVADVAIRGTGSQSPTKKYPSLKAYSEMPYPIYDGVALTNVRKVRFVITSGNSLTGENNQFWNCSEIKFLGTPSTEPEPVKATIANAAYSWVSMYNFEVALPSYGADGGPVSTLYNGDFTDYWQTPYWSLVPADGQTDDDEQSVLTNLGLVPASVAYTSGTTLTFTLDKYYAKLKEIRYYGRNESAKAQVPSEFEVWVDPGTGIFTKAQAYTATGTLALPWKFGADSPNRIVLDTATPAKAFQIFVKKAAGGNGNIMFMCASEIEAYYLP